MSSERNLIKPRVHLGFHYLNLKKTDLSIVPPSTPEVVDVVSVEKPTGKITSLISWLTGKQKVETATNWSEQFNQTPQAPQGLVDIFIKPAAKIVESKNIISSGGGKANIDAAIDALELIQRVNAESVRRGEPHQQIRVAAVAEIMRDQHGAKVREVSLKAPLQEMDKQGQFVRGEARGYAYQVLPFTEQKMLQSERTKQEMSQELELVRRELAMVTIESDMVVVAGVQETDEYGNLTESQEAIENNQPKLPQPNDFWKTEEQPQSLPQQQPQTSFVAASNISYFPGYDAPPANVSNIQDYQQGNEVKSDEDLLAG